jgi:hypothetical protein
LASICHLALIMAAPYSSQACTTVCVQSALLQFQHAAQNTLVPSDGLA